MADDIERILDARPRDLGGFAVGRVLPQAARRAVGPFVFLDHMGPADASPDFAVRPHPHISLATVTYLFAGEVMHRDSVGSEQRRCSTWRRSLWRGLGSRFRPSMSIAPFT